MTHVAQERKRLLFSLLGILLMFTVPAVVVAFFRAPVLSGAEDSLRERERVRSESREAGREIREIREDTGLDAFRGAQRDLP